VTHPLQQRRFRRINASAVRASKKVQLSRTGSRPRAFQRDIGELCKLPLTPLRVVKKRICRLKQIPYIPVIDEASDFKFGTQLGFAKAHHTQKKGLAWLWLGELPKIWGSPSIFT